MRGAILAVLLVAASSCEDNGVSTSVPGSPQEIYFETEYVNSAWAFVYNGAMIDQVGAISSYDPAKDGAGVLFHENGYYSQTELLSKYAHRRSYLRTLSADSLHLMLQLASSVPADAYSDTVRIGADRGSRTYSIYRWCPPVSMFQRIILSVEGDQEFHNTSPSAMALVSCMKGG